MQGGGGEKKTQHADKSTARHRSPLGIWVVLFVPFVADHPAFSHYAAGSGYDHPFGAQSVRSTTTKVSLSACWIKN